MRYQNLLDSRTASEELCSIFGENYSSSTISTQNYLGDPLRSVAYRPTGYYMEQYTELSQDFDRLADRWEAETVNMSSPTQMANSSAMQEIVDMGLAAVPLLLKRFQQNDGFWYLPLSRITGENPVPTRDRGNMRKMRQAWIKWGKTHYGKANRS